jgi:poly-gamma-glutamate synthesis protein (capsule biosynthesis protein)
MPEGRLVLRAIGDMVPTRALPTNGSATAGGFAEVARLLQGADIALGNLDMPLSLRGQPREKIINLRSDPKLADGIASAGFTVLSVANNHAMDYGEVALFDTIEALEAAGIRTVGGGGNLDEATAPAIIEASGWRIAVVAWTTLLPTGAAASDERAGLSPLHVGVAYEQNTYLHMEEPTFPPVIRSWVQEADAERARRQLELLRRDVDFLVVLIHWGGGVSDHLVEYQQPLAHLLIDAGADLVVGSHPHRVHGVEQYKDKTILYSPGTLIEQLSREGASPEAMAFYRIMSPDSYIATIEVRADRAYTVRLTPTTLGENGIARFADDEAFERVAGVVTRMSAALGTAVTVDGRELVVGQAGT